MPFNAITAQSVEGARTVPLVLNQLRLPKGSPIVHVAFAGEGNTGYWAEILADANAPENELGARTTTPARVEEFRTKLRARFAKHVVKSLENVWHDDGRAAGDADITDFVMALPRDVFDSMVAFCKEPSNFRAVADIPVSSPSAIAGK